MKAVDSWILPQVGWQCNCSGIGDMSNGLSIDGAATGPVQAQFFRYPRIARRVSALAFAIDNPAGLRRTIA